MSEDDTAADTGQRTYTLDDLRGRSADEVRDIIDVSKAQIRDLMYGPVGELRTRTDPENKALQMLLDVHKRAEEMYEEHRAIKEVLDRRPKAIEYSRLGAQHDDPYADVRRLSVPEARDRALRVLGDRNATMHMSDGEKGEVDRQVRTSTDIARRVLVTENENYREAWLKLVTRPDGAMYLSNEERESVKAYHEYRVMSEGASGGAAGGYGIPVKLAA